MLMPITTRQIQDDILDPNKRLPDILRKAKVLAYRLDVPEFKQWLDYELDGYYGEEVEVPDYRVTPTTNFGDFAGFGGSFVRNAPIPTLDFPDEVQDYVDKIELRDGTASLERLARSEEPMHKIPWLADAIAFVGQPGRIMEGYALAAAWQILSSNTVEDVLDTIRNRLLTFMLELEDQFPDIAESEEAAKEVPREQATTIFQTHVYGGQPVIASGSQVAQNVEQPSIPQDDLLALLEYVRSLGVPDDDVSELEEAVQEDDVPSETGGFGSRVKGWIGGMVAKTGEGALNEAGSGGMQALIKAISQFYGS